MCSSNGTLPLPLVIHDDGFEHKHKILALQGMRFQLFHGVLQQQNKADTETGRQASIHEQKGLIGSKGMCSIVQAP